MRSLRRFPTVTDGVTSDDLKAAWHGASSGPFAGHPLWMADSTLAAFTALWGAPADGAVQTAAADQLMDDAWKNLPSWGIVPFESLDPKWKVLTVDGQSPIRKDFDHIDIIHCKSHLLCNHLRGHTCCLY